MASNPFNALMDPAQLGQSVANAFQSGMDRHRQASTEQALYDYSKSQSPESAANVGRFDPRLGLQLQDREAQRQEQLRKRQEEAQHQQIAAAALQGDPNARKQIAYFNSELYLKLDAGQKAQADKLYAMIGQQAQSILRLPKEAQEPALQQALAGLQQQGVDTSQFKLTGNPDIDLRSALAISGQLDDFEKSMQPSYMAVPFDSTLVNTRDPAAVAQFGGQPQQQAQAGQAHPNFTQTITPAQFASAFQGIPPAAAAETAAKAGAVVKVTSPQEARQLPSGTWIVLPDNTYGRVP